MEYPLVSCITTTYQKFDYIFETLDSIFSQDYPNIEIIIGDDGSSNFPFKEIEDYVNQKKSQNIKNVLILHENENHGTVWNCSNCRNHANGIYLMGIASDDVFYDNKVISDIVNYFQKSGAEIVTCKRQFFQEGSNKNLVIMPFFYQIKWMKKLNNKILFQKLCSYCFLTGANTYYTKELYERIGGFDLEYRYMEDYPYFLKILRTQTKIHMLERISIKYRYGSGVSTTPNKNNIFIKSLYDDRILYMKKDILPYIQDFPYFRKKQMEVRLMRFEIGKNQKISILKTYIKLFMYSPIGTLVNIWYQSLYKSAITISKIVKF